MLIKGMKKQDSSLYKYFMSWAEEKALFVPYGGKASGPSSPGTWTQKVHWIAISELFESSERTWLG